MLQTCSHIVGVVVRVLSQDYDMGKLVRVSPKFISNRFSYLSPNLHCSHQEREKSMKEFLRISITPYFSLTCRDCVFRLVVN